MTLALGIDTGGTYTDGVLFHDVHGVIAKAKALTTRHDLAVGIAEAVSSVLLASGTSPSDVELVSLSTTLATNAIVEGRGGRVALVLIGFDEGAESRGGLPEALRGDPLIRVHGGHDPHGRAICPLDLDALASGAREITDGISGFAVTGHFATRNPEHEIAARDLLRRETGLPVTCGHELSAKLDGPRRALTSVLNARLIGLIASLIDAAETMMAEHGIVAPLMVVRGDGALMSASVAMTRPIETILSGPAASLVGAAHLTGLADAIVSDIGGTTTDVAVITGGSPRLDERGANVGGHATMVEAVAMTTVGLGGDSEVSIANRGGHATLELGPRRLVPICLAAAQHPQYVHRILDRHLLNDLPSDHDSRFVLPLSDGGSNTAGLDAGEAELLERASQAPASVSELVRGHPALARLNRLVARGLLMIAGFTPTDASHVLRDHIAFDRAASVKAATLMARKRSMVGRHVAADGEAFSEWVVDTLKRRSAELVLDVALGIDGLGPGNPSRHPLMAASLDGTTGIVEVSARLTVPLVGLGASAPIYYPAVAKLLRADGLIPDHADVANAIGAVVGRVRVHADVYISRVEREAYRVHHVETPDPFTVVEHAVAMAEHLARRDASVRALAAGADNAELTIRRAMNTASIEGEDYFVDGTVTASASGRPRLGEPSRRS